jgi:S1-C subfamily serine protease
VLIPEKLKKCVAFIAYRDLKQSRYKLVGTGFFVAVPGASLPSYCVTYVVTAKHVIEGLAAKGAETVYVRVNVAKNGVQYIESKIADWCYHPDASADVAVVCIELRREHDVDYLSTADAANPQSLADEAVGIGDEIFLLGLLSNHAGQTRNLPILRVGNIAAMPGELVTTKLGPTDAYLVETRSIAGFSGSPVFVNV